ncbi:MAG: hypothetical protein DHS20C15_04580 [Planctomycetota bacterium]|nr:MAG: hypothetical protein DHS20C15_04580 [Planctomycetota bacterium]
MPRVGWLVAPLGPRDRRWDDVAPRTESTDLPNERGLHQRRLFDVRIAGQDISFRWRAGTSSEGVRPSSGSGLSLATAGDSEIIEVSWGAAEGGSLSSFVRGRRQPEDDYASAFGRSMQGTAGLQFDPGGRWDWRVQAQQQFVNHVTDPIESMEFSLWARLRF